MPTDQPLIGETWVLTSPTTEPTHEPILGLVSEVSANVVTLVGLTGNRFRVAPSRLALSWTYQSPAWDGGGPCNIHGCPHLAALTITELGLSVRHVCPRHMPVGVLATPVQGPEGGTERHIPSCPCCTLDRLVENILPGVYRSFQCEGCNARMVHILLDRDDVLSDLRTAAEHLDEDHYRVSEVIVVLPLGVIRPTRSMETILGVPLSARVGPPGSAREAFFILARTSRYAIMTPGNIPPALEIPAIDSHWVNRASGTLVVIKSNEGDAVSFETPGNLPQRALMTLADFHTYHRSWSTSPAVSISDIHEGEDWERGTETLKIVSVSHVLQTVTGVMADGTRRSIRVSELLTRWKQISRKSTYDRLLNDDPFEVLGD